MLYRLFAGVPHSWFVGSSGLALPFFYFRIAAVASACTLYAGVPHALCVVALGLDLTFFYSMHQRGTHQVCVLPFRVCFIYLLRVCYLLDLGGVVEVDRCF